MPAYFHRMVGAEMLKIITRISGWAGLILSALIPLMVTGILVWMQPDAVDPTAAPDMNAAMMQSMIPDQALTVLDWTLTGRNILIMPMVLLLVTAQLFAGEWSDRTLRSLLLRPVSRASVLMAKFSALWIYAGACLLISYLFALAGGWIFLGHEAEIIGVTKGYGVCWLRDGALLGIGMLVSTFAPSVAGVVVGTILGLIGELMLSAGFKGADALLSLGWPAQVTPWMPSAALWESWEGYEEVDWPMEPMGALAILFVVVIAGSILRFSRLDVP